MRVDVSALLAEPVGATQELRLSGRPVAEDLELVGELEVSLRLIRTDFGLVAGGPFSATVKAQCHRCLRDFNQSLQGELAAEFVPNPAEDQWPIERDQIDLSVPLGQELLVAIPLRLLCEPDCPGLCLVCGQRLDKPHHHAIQKPETRSQKPESEF